MIHSIVQHVVTLRQGHTDDMTRLDVRLLDCILRRRRVNIGYVILRHILTTPMVTNRLLPYSSIINRIFRHFYIPFESIFNITKRLGGEAIITLKFHQKGEEWVKTASTKNQDTLVAPKDDQMLNNIYLTDQLLDFHLGVRVQASAHPIEAGTSAARASKNIDINTDDPSVPEAPLAFKD